MNTTPYTRSINVNGVKMNGLFDNRMSEELFTYYMMYVLHSYISIDTAHSIIIEEEGVDEIDSDVEEGLDHEQKYLIAMLLGDYIQQCINYKKTINFDKKTIMTKINQQKAAEKDRKTHMLKEFTDEERAVDTMFKKHKLGKWGIGLQKGLTQYVAKTYDRERSEDERYEKIQLTTEAAIAEEIEREEYDMSEVQGESET